MQLQRLDAYSVKILSQELNLRLRGASIRDISSCEGAIVIDTKEGPLTLVEVRDSPFVALRECRERRESNFSIFLKKRLLSGRIVEICQGDKDRVFSVKIEALSPVEGLVTYCLIYEAIPNYANILLLDGKGTIVGTRYTFEGVFRKIKPGEKYVPPPASVLPPIWEMEEASLEDTIRKGISHKIPGVPDPVRKILRKVPQHEAEDLLRETLRQLRNPFFHVAFREGVPLFFSPFRLPELVYTFWKVDETRAFGSLLDAVSYYYTKYMEVERREKLKTEVMKAIKDKLRYLEMREKALEELVAKEVEVPKLYSMANLIMARLSQIPEGAERLEVEDFDGRKVVLRINPRLSPVEFANGLYEQAKKLKRKVEMAKEEIEKVRKEKNLWISMLKEVEGAKDRERLEEIKKEIVLRSPSKTTIKDTGFLRFTSSDGFLILVGRNSRQNEEIYRLASPEDIWLHVRKTKGAHVVIKTGGQKVPERTLIEAAMLAAYFSQAKASSKVAVDYTLRKFVKKPPASPPGFVIYSHERTIVVEPRLPF